MNFFEINEVRTLLNLPESDISDEAVGDMINEAHHAAEPWNDGSCIYIEKLQKAFLKIKSQRQ